MSDKKVVSFEEYLKKKKGVVTLNKDLLNALSEDIKENPGLIEWHNFQNTFNKYKLFLRALYIANHQSNGNNPNSGYFISFESRQTTYHIDQIVEANEWLERKSVVIDAQECTYRNIVKQIKGEMPHSNRQAHEILRSVLYQTDTVIIIANISKSNLTPSKSSWARSIIKINDDAHFKNVTPRSDILFVDSASFLERSWSQIGDYLDIFA